MSRYTHHSSPRYRRPPRYSMRNSLSHTRCDENRQGKEYHRYIRPRARCARRITLGTELHNTQVTLVWSSICAERMDDTEIVSLEVGARYSALRWSTLTRLRPQRVYEIVDTVAEVGLWASMGTLEDQDASFRARSGDFGSSLVTSSKSSVWSVVFRVALCRAISYQIGF